MDLTNRVLDFPKENLKQKEIIEINRRMLSDRIANRNFRQRNSFQASYEFTLDFSE